MRRLRHAISRVGGRGPIVWWRHRGLERTDVFLASYPRSGNTWLRFMVYDLLTGRESSFDTVNREIPDVGNHRGTTVRTPEGCRVIKTHEPRRKEYGRTVYLVRDPRDVVLSEYNFQVWRGLHQDPFSVFFRRFVTGRANGYGTWGDHVRSWLPDADDPGPTLLLRFEDLRADPVSTLGEVAAFLGLPVGLDRLNAAVDRHSVDAMREKEEVARSTVHTSVDPERRFIRIGTSGGWREALDAEQVRAVESGCEDLLERFSYGTGNTAQ